jgi:hypothetical protein
MYLPQVDYIDEQAGMLYITVPHGFPWTPHGVLTESMESPWSPHRVHEVPVESSWSPRGVLIESSQSP